jgi:hypothetical protein
MDKIAPLMAVIEQLRQGKFNHEAAEIVIENIKMMVEKGEFAWDDLGTSRLELGSILFKLKRSAASTAQSEKP